MVELSQRPEGETVVELTGFSAAERQLLARRGHALPDGSYPIPDKDHLHPAAVLAASGYGDHVAARKLIRRRAKELGVHDLSKLPGFGPASTGGSESLGSGGGSGDGPSGGGDAAAMSATHQRLRRAGLSDTDIVRLAAGEADDGLVELARRAAADEDDTVSRIVRENSHLFGNPGAKARSGRRATTAVRDEDPSDRQQPRDGGAVHPEIQRYLSMLGTAGGREKPTGSVQVHRPLSPAQRAAGERRELVAGGPQRWE